MYLFFLYLLFTVPGAVDNITSAGTSRQVHLAWHVLSASCPLDYFIVRYRLYKRRACSSPVNNTIQHTLNTSGQNCSLDNLEPYSRYDVSVLAVNEAGMSEPKNSTLMSQWEGNCMHNQKYLETIMVGVLWEISYVCQSCNTNSSCGIMTYYAVIYTVYIKLTRHFRLSRAKATLRGVFKK